MDRLTARYRACVTRVDANYATDAGRQLASAYGVKSHPVVLVIDARNTVVWRVNGVPDEALLATHITAVCRT